MDGSTTCARLGCDDVAVAMFGFDARECLVWLDPLGSDGRGAGVLCARHADRMTPPYGWNLLDRRGAESRLWIGRTKLVAAAPPPRRRERAPRVRSHAPTGPRLPFDTTPLDTTPLDTAPFDSVSAAAPAAPPPVLREAGGEQVREAVREPDAPVAPVTDSERESWSPHGRPGPELEHVLDARTPLLARAFEAARPVDAPD